MTNWEQPSEPSTYNGSADIMRSLGRIEGRQGIIFDDVKTMKTDLSALTQRVTKVESFSKDKPLLPFYQTERFWFMVLAVGVALAGSPETAKLLLR